jgi:hypothetical protein
MQREHPMPSVENPWDFFDSVYCINLADRPDRKDSAAAEFSRVGLLSKVEFISVFRHRENSEQGIFESHLRCIEKGLAAGAKTVAIFEDDVIFRRYSPETLRACTDFVSGRRWSALFFGCLVKQSRSTGSRSVRRIRYRSLAHAYALNRPFAERLSAKRWTGTAFDAVLRAESADYFAAYPSFAFQSDSATDNTKGLRIDRFRRWCGGLCRIQMMNEFYHRRRTAIIAAHALALLAIVLTALGFFGAGAP